MELTTRLTAAFICVGLLVNPSLGQIMVPDDHPTIQEAIDAAPPGSTILVRPGVYHEAIDFSKSLALRSMGGQMVTRIDATGIPDASTVRMIAVPGEPPALEGFTISGGAGGLIHNQRGGGIAVSGCDPVITDCTFTDNHGEFGGAAQMFASRGSFVRCRFVANTASGGGALNCYARNPALIDCIFEANTAAYGGAIVSMTCEPIIEGCEFRANTAPDGGAMWISSGGHAEPEISDSVFCDNAEGDILGDWIDQGGNSFPADCACRADFNADAQLDIFDFLSFQSAWVEGEPAADVAAPFGTLDLFDFLGFQSLFGLGC
jgi:hypothetical protein